MQTKTNKYVKVGDIFVSSWGYEQTNVDFYRVTKLAGKTQVYLEKLETIRDYNENGHMTYDATPGEPVELLGRYSVNVFDDKPETSSLMLSSYQYAKLWDGKPKWGTSYA